MAKNRNTGRTAAAPTGTGAARTKARTPAGGARGPSRQQQPREEQTYARTPAGEKAAELRRAAREEEAFRIAEEAEEAAAAAEEEQAPKRAALAKKRRDRAAKATGAEGGDFVLLAGEHSEAGVNYVYDRGSETVVSSPLPLDVLFANKFRRLSGETLPPRDLRDLVGRPGVTDPPLAETRPHGQETQLTRDTDPAAQMRLRAARGDLREDGEEAPRPAAGTEEEETDRGEDVTAEFEDAADAGVTVYKQGRTYCVVDADDETELHDEEFTRKEQVNELIKGRLGDEDEADEE